MQKQLDEILFFFFVQSGPQASGLNLNTSIVCVLFTYFIDFVQPDRSMDLESADSRSGIVGFRY